MKDDPNTKAQAQALLKEYYEQEKAQAEAGQVNDTLPKKPNLLSWNLREDGVMVVVDGASGRKLEFQPSKPEAKTEPPVKTKGAKK